MLCEYCMGMFKHHPRCPNAEPAKSVYKCSECGEYIYDGDMFYRIGGSIYCEECMKGFREYAENP